MAEDLHFVHERDSVDGVRNTVLAQSRDRSLEIRTSERDVVSR